MTDFTLPDELAEQLEEFARRENRSPEDVLKSMFADYIPKPPVEAADNDLRALNSRLYERARRYWREVGNQARLALTDEQLDEQFWLFDQDDIPRLKSDEGQFERLPNPLAGLVGLLDDETDATDLSTTVRQTLANSTHPKYGWTTRGLTD